MFRRTRAALAVAAILSLVAACGGGSDDPTTPGAPKSGGTLTLGVVLPATTFSAADSSFGNESPYLQAVYDTLVKADPDGKIVPSLATEWKYDDPKTTLEMTLRNDVTFTDGTKFNAAAAAQNLKRFQAGTSQNKSYLVNMADATAVDDTHLKITLKQSDPAFLTYLTQNAGYQQSPASFNNPDIKTNPVGSGPYTLDTGATVIGSSYAYNKNPNYWDKASQHYDKIVLKVFVDPTANLNAIQGKQINGTRLVNNDALAQVQSAGYTLNSFEINWGGLQLLDRAGKLNPALGNVKVRQAINYAFDRKALLATIPKSGTVTTQIFPPRSAAYDPALDSKYPYDPAKAKALLAEAGYPNGFNLAMPSVASLGTASFTLLGQQLKDIGINVTFTDAGTQFISDILSAKYAVTYINLQMDPTDWQEINFILSPTATWNPFKYQDPKVDALIKTIHDAKTDAEATPALKELNAYIVDQAWFAPWYRPQANYVTDAKTSVKTQVGNIYPYLWNFQPK